MPVWWIDCSSLKHFIIFLYCQPPPLPTTYRLGHKNLIICFSGTTRVKIKNFCCLPTNKCEKSSTHSELSVQSGRHLPCLWLVGFCILVHPLSRIFTEHHRNIVFIHKRKKNKNKKSPSLILF